MALQSQSRLTILRYVGTIKRKRRVLVRCSCGVEKVLAEDDVRSGSTKSCGCFRRQRMAGLTLTHGHTRKAVRSYLYTAWMAMRERADSEHYRARGIRLFEPWRGSFEVFRDHISTHLGKRPRGHTLDRIDNDDDYRPGNVRWASGKQQARNRSDNTIVTVNGVSRCIAEWAEINGLNSAAICARIRYGWAPERAVTQPLQKWSPRLEAPDT